MKEYIVKNKRFIIISSILAMLILAVVTVIIILAVDNNKVKGMGSFTVETYYKKINSEEYEYIESQTGTTKAGNVVRLKDSDLLLEGYTINKGKSILSGKLYTNQTVVFKIYYDRNFYNIKTINLNDENGSIKVVDDDFVFGSKILLEAIPNNGYLFLGWFNSDDILISNNEEYIYIVDGKTLIINAKFKFGQKGDYKIEIYEENTTNNEYVLLSDVSYKSEVGNTVILDENDYLIKGFVLDKSKSIMTGNIVTDGPLILKVFLSRKIISIRVECDAPFTVLVNGKLSYKYGESIKLSITQNEEYTVLNWSLNNEIISYDHIMMYEAQSYDMVFVLRLTYSVEYAIEIYIQDKNLNYIYEKTITETGKVDTLAVYDNYKKGYEIAPIKSNNRIVLKPTQNYMTVYYNILQFQVSTNQEKHFTVSGLGQYYYNDEVTIKITITNPDYKFKFFEMLGEQIYLTTQTFLMVDTNIIINVVLELRQEVLYEINVYDEMIETANFELVDQQTETGRVDDEISINSTNYEKIGFEVDMENSMFNVKLSMELGKNIIQIYRKRLMVSITVTGEYTDQVVINGVGEYKFEERVLLEYISTPLFVLINWSSDETILSTFEQCFLIMGSKDIEVVLKLEKKVQYSVHLHEEDIYDETYREVEETYHDALLDEIVELDPTEYIKYGFNINLLKSVLSISIVQETSENYLDIFYERKMFSIVTSSNHDDLISVLGAGIYKYQTDVLLSIYFPENTNYSDIKWMSNTQPISTTSTCLLKDLSTDIVVEVYITITSKYIIERYLERTDDTYAQLEDRIYFTDIKTTISIDVEQWKIVNYTFDLSKSKLSGSTSLDTLYLMIYYTVDRYQLILSSNGNGTSSQSGQYKYGENVVITHYPDPGFEFDKYTFTSGSVNLVNDSFLMPNYDVEISISFKAVVKSYQIVVRKENVDGKFEIVFETTRSTNYGELITYDYSSFIEYGFENSPETIDSILIDDSENLIIKIFINRVKVVLIIRYVDDLIGGFIPHKESYRYGEQITLEVDVYLNYQFQSWNIGENSGVLLEIPISIDTITPIIIMLDFIQDGLSVNEACYYVTHIYMTVQGHTDNEETEKLIGKIGENAVVQNIFTKGDLYQYDKATTAIINADNQTKVLVKYIRQYVFVTVKFPNNVIDQVVKVKNYTAFTRDMITDVNVGSEFEILDYDYFDTLNPLGGRLDAPFNFVNAEEMIKDEIIYAIYYNKNLMRKIEIQVFHNDLLSANSYMTILLNGEYGISKLPASYSVNGFADHSKTKYYGYKDAILGEHAVNSTNEKDILGPIMLVAR